MKRDRQSLTLPRRKDEVAHGRKVPGRRAVRIAAEPEPRFSRSLEYGLALLDGFNGKASTLGVADIAEIMATTRSTTHRYAATLTALGFLEQDHRRKYLLSPKAADVGASVLRTLIQQAGSRPILEALRKTTRHTVSLAVLDESRVIYAQRLLGHRAGQYQADLELGVGAHIPVHCTALGKALLASFRGTRQRELLARLTLTREGPNTLTSGEELVAELVRIQADGLAICDQEQAPGVRSIAAAIPTIEGSLPMAISVTAPAQTHSVETLRETFGPHVKKAAERISRNLSER